MRTSGVDDVRIAIKDKSRRVASGLKPSPRGSPNCNSPLPGVGESADWQAMYTTGLEPPMSHARARAKELLAEADQAPVSVSVIDPDTQQLDSEQAGAQHEGAGGGSSGNLQQGEECEEEEELAPAASGFGGSSVMPSQVCIQL